MMGLIIGIHVFICALLIIIILVQSGRGGGLVESFSSVESMFGTKTSAFLTRTTSMLSVLFFITCIMLALMSARRSRSLLKDTRAVGATQGAVLPEALQQLEQVSAPAEVPTPAEEPAAQQAPVQGPAEEPPVAP